MPEPTPREIIRLEVKDAIAAEVESYRKTMERYSENLEKAASNHSQHLQTSTRWIASGFVALALAAVGVFYYFVGQSAKAAKDTANELMPGLINQEVNKIPIVSRALGEMDASIQAKRLQVEVQATDKLTTFGTNLQSRSSEELRAFSFFTQNYLSNSLTESAKTTEQELSRAINGKGEFLKADLIRAAGDAVKTILDNQFEERVKVALNAAVVRFEDGSVFQFAVPAGTIVPYGGQATNLPIGWLLCNGDPQPRSLTNLYAAIGTNWGEGNGKDTFNLPDLRGLFLRGVDDAISNKDPDRGTRTDKQGRTVSAKVGSYQADELRSHSHAYLDGQPHDTLGQKRDYYVKGKNDAVYSHDDKRTTTATGGSETRPKNAYVYYIIKY